MIMIYDIKSQPLDIIYKLNKTPSPVAYDMNKNIVFELRKYYVAMSHLLSWLLEQATYDAQDMTYVKERYRMDNSTWVTGATAIACAQAMYTYGTVWHYTGEEKYLELARSLYAGLSAGRTSDGGFEMYVYNTGAPQHDKYTGGNSEVPINFFRMAELDAELSSQYIQEGLLSTEYLLSKQQSDGSWKTSVNEPAKSSMFTSQAIAAISMGYKYASDKSVYLNAIQKGLFFISSRQLQDGRIKTTIEEADDAGQMRSEFWRPPASDQAIVVRGLAIVENNMADVMDVSSIRTLRKHLIEYLNSCIGEEGAIRNGLGESTLVNDIYGITDHVYVTSWAIEAYYFSGLLDNDATEIAKAVGIVDFCSGNLYYSNNEYTNGTLRGAYNVRDNNWDTSALHQDGLNEGGADMIYVGWVNSPILTWLTKFSYSDPYLELT